MLIKIGDCWVDPDEIVAVRDLFEPGDDTPALQIVLRGAGAIHVEAAMDEAEAALIDAGFIEDPYPEEAGPELSEAERAELADLYDRDFKWLARDADGKLYAFVRTPEKHGAYWDDDPDPGQRKPELIKEAFDFVDSTDKEPWSIAYLLVE